MSRSQDSTSRDEVRRTDHKRILVVEDNRLDMILFSALVGSQGYGVLQAVSASEGIKLAREQHPDLIIMDIRLPDMSGFEATRILKAEHATHDIPIIVTSSYGPYVDKEQLRACGCDSYMPTPLDVSAFVDMICLYMGMGIRSDSTSAASCESGPPEITRAR
jgi:two-component system cell cycle response regulator DivK